MIYEEEGIMMSQSLFLIIYFVIKWVRDGILTGIRGLRWITLPCVFVWRFTGWL
jgi:hypothetical protein